MVRGQGYVYRYPGIGTEKYINRKSEAASMKVASRLGLDNTFICMDGKKGWKLSRYIQNARELDYQNISDVRKALTMMRKLHDAKIISEYDFDIWEKTERFIEQLKNAGRLEIEGFDELYRQMKKIKELVENDEYSEKCLCHCDCYSPNFLIDDENQMYLIDWEYSGNDDPASDLGTFICCSEYSFEEAVHVITLYLDKIPEKKELGHYLGYVAIASYYWYIWALYQEFRGNPVGTWLYRWFKNSKAFMKKTLEYYD